jgi:FkbM family methyltransferase
MFWEERGYNTVSFEPETREFEALQKNLTSKSTYNFGLWFECSEQILYRANETGDSSLINSHLHSEFIELQVITLDSLNLYNTHTIGLIKIEAEGAEPEIIQGGAETIKKAHYVTCDAGFERGVNNESTIVEVTSLLNDLGFNLIGFNPNRYTLLFKNTTVNIGLLD